MVNVNLLPWREYERKYQIRVLKKIFVLAITVFIIILVAAHLWISRRENSIRKRITILNEKINSHLTSYATYNKVTPYKMENVAKNDITISPYVGKLLFELGKIKQKTTCFNEIKRLNQSLILSGSTKSLNELTLFLDHFPTIFTFSEIQIKTIEKKENGLIHFKLQALIEGEKN